MVELLLAITYFSFNDKLLSHIEIALKIDMNTSEEAPAWSDVLMLIVLKVLSFSSLLLINSLCEILFFIYYCSIF